MSLKNHDYFNTNILHISYLFFFKEEHYVEF